MSIALMSVVRSRQIGSPTDKSVLLLMADFASDDGSGIWASKGRMSADLELSIRTVQRSTKALISLGLTREIGERKCTNGATIEYAISCDRLDALPLTRSRAEADADTSRNTCQADRGSGVTLAPHPRPSDIGTSATVTSDPCQNGSQSIREPSDKPPKNSSMTAHQTELLDFKRLAPQTAALRCVPEPRGDAEEALRFYNDLAAKLKVEVATPHTPQKCARITNTLLPMLEESIAYCGGISEWRATVSKLAFHELHNGKAPRTKNNPNWRVRLPWLVAVKANGRPNIDSLLEMEIDHDDVEFQLGVATGQIDETAARILKRRSNRRKGMVR